jgi:hypothetical protein
MEVKEGEKLAVPSVMLKEKEKTDSDQKGSIEGTYLFSQEAEMAYPVFAGGT